MNILFNNPKNFVSQSGGIVDVSDSSKFTVTFPFVKANKSTTGAAGSSSTVTFITSLLISVGAAVLTGGSLELMWCMINTLQIIYYIGLMSLLYPPHVNVFFGFVALANANNVLLERLSIWVFSKRITDVNPVTSRFEALGMQNDSFIGNASDKIPVIFAVLCYFVFIVICLIVLKFVKKENWFTRLIRKLDRGLRYNFLIRLIIELYLDLSVSSILNLSKVNKDSNFIDIVFSIIAFQTNFFLIGFTFCYVMIHNYDIKFRPEKCF